MAGQGAEDFEPAGAALWEELMPGPAGPGEAAIATEACRIVDRLDRLHVLLAGDHESWIELNNLKGHDDVVEIVVNNALSEARQQATALRGLLAELRQMRGGKLARVAAGGSKSDDLAAKREERRRAVAASS